MCRSINPESISTFVETIRIEHETIYQLSYHNARMNRTRHELFGVNDTIDLATMIQPEGFQARTKCRVEYAEELLNVEYSPYQIRPVHSLHVVHIDDIDYHYKSSNRQCLTEAFNQRGNCDDVLIVRRGLLTDTSIGNVALWNGNVWLTPKIPLLEGTKRALLLEKGLIYAADIREEDLDAFSCIRIFNALIDFGEVECPLPQK